MLKLLHRWNFRMSYGDEALRARIIVGCAVFMAVAAAGVMWACE